MLVVKQKGYSALEFFRINFIYAAKWSNKYISDI